VAEKELTEENFQKAIGSDQPILVDFWAPWCGPCQMMGPVVDEIAEEAKDFSVGKLNIDDNPEVASKFNVMSIPTFLIFKKGKVVEQLVGTMPKEVIIEGIKKHIDK